MLDSAVMWFGITIENALQERVKVTVGSVTESHPKYTLTRLLSQGFKLPKPVNEEVSTNPWAPFLSWIGKPRSGVKRWVYKNPEESEESEEKGSED